MTEKSIFTATSLTSNAVEVLGQLFVHGPTWDGNIVSKAGRGELCSFGLAEHAFGWAFLTRDGVQAAIEWDKAALKKWNNQRWYRKAATLD
jgi:hypothetical protein